MSRPLNEAAIEEPIVVEFSEENDSDLSRQELQEFSQAVLWASDWTAETVIAQLRRGNIEMNPRFQRRDAWSRTNKSRFIESLIMGLPIPQIVLAERRDRRGQYIVLDGKQRLLTLLQFSGGGDGNDVGFRLNGLQARSDLNRKRFQDFQHDPSLQDDFNALSTHIIRAVVIRNWPSTAFLHLVFLRLNTGSLKLSPQELRQAIVPGPFSDYVDDSALALAEVQSLLGRRTPDPRMRDVELLVRFLSFAIRLPDYSGRMKDFLDQSCLIFNDEWEIRQPQIEDLVARFRAGIVVLQDIFGATGVARKLDSRLFNRSIFDALAYYASLDNVRAVMAEQGPAVREIYEELIRLPDFQIAIESDTAGVPHTADRIRMWGEMLHRRFGLNLPVPRNVNGQIIIENLG